MKGILLELIYVCAGLIAIMTALYALRDPEHPSPKGTALFGATWHRIYCRQVHSSRTCRFDSYCHGVYDGHEKG